MDCFVEKLSITIEEIPMPIKASMAVFCFSCTAYFKPKVVPTLISLEKSNGLNLSLMGVKIFPTKS